MPAFPDIIFDLDGTLVDSLPGIARSFGRALNRISPGQAAPDLRPFIGPPIREIFRQALNEANPARLSALVAAFREDYDDDGWSLTVAYPGVADTLAYLAANGFVCHVLTNKPVTATTRILHHLGLDRFFRHVVTRESRDPPFASKTEAALDLAPRLGRDARDVVLVGDSKDDTEAATACGFRFFAAAYGFGHVSQTGAEAQRPADAILTDFPSILAQFKIVNHKAAR